MAFRKTNTVPPRGRASCSEGFTLTELMVALSLSGIFVASAMETFIFQRRALNSSMIVSEMQQDVRTAIDMVSRDLRMAGYGLNIGSGDLPLWLDWARDLDGNSITMTNNPHVVDGDTGPDAVWIAAAFDKAPARLASAVTAGATILALHTGEGIAFDTSEKKIIYIGKSETVRIVSIAGDTLTISAHPTMNGVGLAYDHTMNTPVERVVIRSYEWVDPGSQYPVRPFLARDESTTSQYLHYWQRMIALGIKDFQLTRIDNRMQILIVGKASVKDNQAQIADKYRTFELESDVFMRNL